MKPLTEWLWRRLAKVLAKPAVVDWLIRRASRTPYRHLTDANGSIYMKRYWLFNAYPDTRASEFGSQPIADSYCSWLPSIRLHYIMRADSDPHMHDHPWDARTIILRGWYVEETPMPAEDWRRKLWTTSKVPPYLVRVRFPSDTVPILHGNFHRISCVPDDGCWTLFITWKQHSSWGFLVDGKKIDYREYLQLDKE